MPKYITCAPDIGTLCVQLSMSWVNNPVTVTAVEKSRGIVLWIDLNSSARLCLIRIPDAKKYLRADFMALVEAGNADLNKVVSYSARDDSLAIMLSPTPFTTRSSDEWKLDEKLLSFVLDFDESDRLARIRVLGASKIAAPDFLFIFR